MSHVPVVLSLLGLLGLTFLFPLLALAGRLGAFWNRTKDFLPDWASKAPSQIEIVIPAHNEGELIGPTLKSIEESIMHLRSRFPESEVPRVAIHIGADHCTDNTVDAARRFRDVKITEFPSRQGKWSILKRLCSESSSEWTILVDAGTLWPKSLLTTLVTLMATKPNLIGLSPGYHPLKGGLLSKTIWFVEASLKRLEVLCGGPVSIHGATVSYRTAPLKRALSYLGEREWLNDDVVIPLALRALYPGGLLLYPVGTVYDLGVRMKGAEYRRRRRIMIGNIQWVRRLWLDCFRQNPVVGLVAARRLFRLLWAYWFLLVFVEISIATPTPWIPWLGPLALLLAICLLCSKSGRQLGSAALVSFLLPFRLKTHEDTAVGAWT